MATDQINGLIRQLRRAALLGDGGGLSDQQLLGRFLRDREEAAFEALVCRHGPMVLGVCRRVLRNAADADDAFQATFLVLVRKAAAIGRPESLGNWLYGVAYRTALEARTAAARRRLKERQVADMAGRQVPEDDRWNELRRLLDQELARLPEKYRAPVVLCELEGKTHKEAGRLLGCPEGTISGRLARARKLLAKRLTRHGVALTGGGLAAALSQAAPAAPVPPTLAHATMKAATGIVAGQAGIAGAVPAQVAALTEGVLKTMLLTKLKITLAVVLLASGVGVGVGVLSRRAPAGEQAEPPQPAAAQADKPAAPADAPTPGRFQLKNGLRVILRPVQGAQNTALLVFYSVGGDHDPKDRSGLAHFIEHVYCTAAAGTEKARTVAQYMGRYPAGANAQTGENYTLFATVFPAKDFDKEVRDAAARMGDLRVTAADLDRERPRILNELDNMYGNIPALGALNQARSLVRPAPLGGRHGGLPEALRAINVEEIQERWRRYYKPANALVVLAGAVDPAAARKAITEHFAKLPAGEKAPAPPKPDKPRLGTIREIAVKPLAPEFQAQACLAYAAPAPTSDLYAPYLVLVKRLIAQSGKLGAQQGAFPSPIHASLFDDPSLVGISAPAKKGETAAQAEKRLLAFVAETTAPRLDAKEVEAVMAEFGTFFGFTEPADALLAQNPYFVAFTLGRRQQLGIDTAKLKAALTNLRDEDVRRAAKEIFGPDRHAGAFISMKGK